MEDTNPQGKEIGKFQRGVFVVEYDWPRTNIIHPYEWSKKRKLYKVKHQNSLPVEVSIKSCKENGVMIWHVVQQEVADCGEVWGCGCGWDTTLHKAAEDNKLNYDFNTSLTIKHKNNAPTSPEVESIEDNLH